MAAFPTIDKITSPTTLLTALGGVKASVGLINTTYADLTAANANLYLKDYPGAEIVLSNNVRYYRNQAASDWIPYLSTANFNFTSGNLSPLFTTSVLNPTTSPALSFTLTNQTQGTVFGNAANGNPGAPSFSSTPTLGVANTTEGSLTFYSATSGSAVVRLIGGSGNFNFNLPLGAGGIGQVLTSQGGGTAAMTWTTPGSGTVTTFSAGNLSPLFTTSVATATTTPALTFALTNAGGGTVFGNPATTAGAPSYTTAPVIGIAGTTLGTLGLSGSTSGVITIRGAAAAGTYNFVLPTTAGTAGQVLTSQGGVSTAMTWTTLSSGGFVTADNGLTANTATNVRWGGTLLQNTTVTGIDTYTITFDNTLFMVRGQTFEAGSDPVSGAGVRMFFAPKYAAFRAGSVSDTQWNAVNLGYGSIGLGDNSKASGERSFAFAAQALNLLSIAMGSSSVAQADQSFAVIGGNTTGEQSVAIGSNVIQSGYYGFSAGYWLLGKSYAGAVVGSYNDSTAATSAIAYNVLNRAFQIGIGASDGARKNAMTVLFNGKTTLNQYGVGTFPGTAAYNLAVDSSGNVIEVAAGGGGTVTSFSAGTLSPLFTTSVATATTTPALTFALTNAAGGTVFGNNASSSGAPAYTSTPVLGVAGATLGTIGLAGNTSGVITIRGAAVAGTYNFVLPTTAGNIGQVLNSGGGGTAPMTWTTPLSGGAGTYTPTLTNVMNVTSSTSYQAQYLYVVDATSGKTVVTVSGRFQLVFTTGAGGTRLGISLPIGSGFTAEENLGGVGGSNSLTNGSFAIRADVTNDRAEFYATAPGTGVTETYWFTFTYYIVQE